MLRKLVVMVLAAAFAGCGVTVPLKRSEKNLSLLRPGMARAEVEIALETPPEWRAPNGVEVYRLYREPRLAAVCNAVSGFFTATLTWWVPLCQYEARAEWHLRYDEAGRLVDYR